MSHLRALVVYSLEGEEEWVHGKIVELNRTIFNRKGTMKALYYLVLLDSFKGTWREALLALLRPKERPLPR